MSHTWDCHSRKPARKVTSSRINGKYYCCAVHNWSIIDESEHSYRSWRCRLSRGNHGCGGASCGRCHSRETRIADSLLLVLLTISWPDPHRVRKIIISNDLHVRTHTYCNVRHSIMSTDSMDLIWLKFCILLGYFNLQGSYSLLSTLHSNSVAPPVPLNSVSSIAPSNVMPSLMRTTEHSFV